MTDNKDDEITASKIRGGLLEIETKTSQVLQSMENMTVNGTPAGIATHPVEPTAQLHPDKLDAAELMGHLAHLIASPEISPGDLSDGEYLFPPLDEVSQMALISHSMAAYLHHLRRDQLVRLTARIYSDTNRWLSNIFRFIDGTATYHHDSTDTIVRTLRLAIMSRAQQQQPVVPLTPNSHGRNFTIYVCEESAMLSLQFAVKQLGLSMDCIRMVPQNTTPTSSGGSIGTMDVSVLQRMILADVANKHQPILVIASAGTPIMGSVDNIARIYDVCKSQGIWMHCRGHCLAALATTMGNGDIKTVCDSMSLNIGSWLGVPSLPVVLLHRPIPNVTSSDLESDPVISRRLSSLPLWTSLQALGRDAISQKVLMAFEACRVVQDIVSKCYGLRILSKQPNTGRGNSLMEMVNEPLNPTLLFETAQCVVVFQFDCNSVVPEESSASSSSPSTQKDTNPFNQPSDRMNVWLGEILQRDCPEIDLEILDHPLYGTIIRFCPLELGMGVTVPSVDTVRNFAECLHGQVEILVATEHHKLTFRRLLEGHRVLRSVDLPEWAGLGGVRYVPEGWEAHQQRQGVASDEVQAELNSLNTELVEQLRATDSAFALGEGADGFVCVKFGMVTIETDVQELLQLVISCGERVQENSRMLDVMAESVKRAIETVTADLQRESDEKLWQEGILRHVPVVGSFVNWWSPQSKEVGVKGRSLNLTHGVVESTENIYRYHMQMKGGETTTPGNKSPPPPMVQQTVGGTAAGESAGHSRNVSQGSAKSQQPVVVLAKQESVTRDREVKEEEEEGEVVVPVTQGNVAQPGLVAEGDSVTEGEGEEKKIEENKDGEVATGAAEVMAVAAETTTGGQ